ncbi:VWA domain-containing protein [Spongiibacter sp. KMU-166]|uniref:VWA domain-containing protein n=1 Tax=Spongiibacter thalassae TaxID=2721624 RepID=A0ABX1GA69_9GAMM|nr:VWA domain-containing protein [Spongiibacter thalassae]NKI16052.1 VWA domain-containing protein [Spongiibacter thalassae]
MRELEGDKRSHLRVLATAIAGRTLEVDSADSDTSWTDGQTIYLAADDGPHTVVIQAALVGVGCFATMGVLKTLGRLRTQRRYMLLEVVRALHVYRGIAPPAVVRAVDNLQIADIPDSQSHSLHRAKGSEALPEMPSWFGTIKPTQVLAHSLRHKPPAADAQAKGERSSSKDEGSDSAEDDTSEKQKNDGAGMSNPLANLLRWMLGSSRSGTTFSTGGVELPGVVGRVSARTGTQIHTQINRSEEPASEEPSFKQHSYPEWDSRCGVFRPHWCSVFERNVDVPTGTQPVELRRDERLRRALATLGLAYERHRRQPYGDGIDVTALVDYAVDRTLGSAADTRVYEMRRRTARDLSALVLLDASGSTAKEADEGGVFEAQRRVAAGLVSILDDLGDRVAAYGFRSWGRHNVQLLKIKEFGEVFDAGARRKMSALSPGGFTRLGAAIRHGTQTLKHQGGTDNRLLIVVGDGFPFDDGYESDYAQDDVSKALSEAVESGVGCVCVAVNSDTDEVVLARAWGGVPYLRLTDTNELHRVVMPVFRGGLHQAASMGRDGRQRQ